MKCPICKKEVQEKKYKPFCSKRCADLDLANWFNEKYSFVAQEVSEEDLEQLNTADNSSDKED